jgi:hypothetical protein
VCSSDLADVAVGSYKELRDTYDIVVDCCAPKNELVAAIGKVKSFGTLSSTGWHFKKTLLPLMQMHAIGMTFRIGLCNALDGATQVAKLIRDGNLSLAPATTKLDDWDNAINAFLGDSTKIIVHRAYCTLCRRVCVVQSRIRLCNAFVPEKDKSPQTRLAETIPPVRKFNGCIALLVAIDLIDHSKNRS